MFDLFKTITETLFIKFFGKYLFTKEQNEFYQSVENYLERSHKEVADILNRL